MVYALIALLALELMLQMTWNAPYFVRGIRIFERRIAAPAEARSWLALGSLERDLATSRGAERVFHTLSDGRVAFRNSFMGPRSYSVMRGLISVDARRNQVRVEGLLNWHTLGFAVLFTAMAVAVPKAWPTLFFLPFSAFWYYVQRRQFNAVVDAIQAQMAGYRPVEPLLAG